MKASLIPISLDVSQEDLAEINELLGAERLLVPESRRAPLLRRILRAGLEVLRQQGTPTPTVPNKGM